MESWIGLGKILLTLAAVPILFVLYYRYGPWPSGFMAQRSAVQGEAVSRMKRFVTDQETYQFYHGEFDRTLHKNKPEYAGEKYQFVFADESSEVAKVCSDCTFGKDRFKIGVIGHFRDEITIWTIDSAHNIVNIKPF